MSLPLTLADATFLVVPWIGSPAFITTFFAMFGSPSVSFDREVADEERRLRLALAPEPASVLDELHPHVEVEPPLNAQDVRPIHPDESRLLLAVEEGNLGAGDGA